MPVLVAGWCATAALGQTPTRDEPFPKLLEGRQWGPLLIEPKLVIDRIGYDGNIFLASDENPDEVKESDIVAELGPDVTAQIQFGPRLALTAHDKLSAEIFLENSSLNHADNELDLQFDALLGPVLLTTEGGFLTSESRPNSEIDERTRRKRRTLSQRLRLFASPRTDFSLQLARERVRFSDADSAAIAERLDRDEESVELEAGWRLRGGTRIFVRFVDEESDFESDADRRDAEQKTTLLGVELSAGARLRGRFSFGPSELRSIVPGSGLTEFDGTVSDASVTYLPTGATRFTLRAGREARFSTFEENLYFEETEYGLELTSLRNLWGIQAGWNERDIDYPNESPAIGERRTDRISNVYAGVLFRAREGFELGLRIGRRDRDSNFPRISDDQNYVTTTGGFSF